MFPPALFHSLGTALTSNFPSNNTPLKSFVVFLPDFFSPPTKQVLFTWCLLSYFSLAAQDSSHPQQKTYPKGKWQPCTSLPHTLPHHIPTTHHTQHIIHPTQVPKRNDTPNPTMARAHLHRIRIHLLQHQQTRRRRPTPLPPSHQRSNESGRQRLDGNQAVYAQCPSVIHLRFLPPSTCAKRLGK